MYGLSNNKYNHALQFSLQPNTSLTHGNIGNLHAFNAPAASIIHFWFTTFFYENGYYDPISSNIHIPVYITKELLYEMFQAKHQHLPHVLSCLKTFSIYLKVHFLNVKFLKHTQLG